MEHIKVFTSKFVQELGRRLQNEEVIKKYIEGKSPNFSNADTLDTLMRVESFPKLDAKLSPFENSRILYEAFMGMDRTMASDQRLWAWLAHVPFMDYMSKRWPVAEQEEEKRAGYIVQHWFVETQAARDYLRHGIAMLWWGAHMTYDKRRDDPFEVTREFFQLADYTRVLAGSLGKSDMFVRTLMEAIIDNNHYFKQNKQDKVRALMRQLNFMGAYKELPALSEEELRDVIRDLM